MVVLDTVNEILDLTNKKISKTDILRCIADMQKRLIKNERETDKD